MSRQTARLALDQLSGRPALVAPQHVSAPVNSEVTSTNLMADMRDLSSANLSAEKALFEERKELLVQAYGFRGGPVGAPAKPFAFSDGKAIIPIHGTLINRFAYSFGYVTGYDFIRSQVAAAEADPEVDGIIFDVNSNGGMCAGCPETGAAIAGTTKPTLAVVDSNCYSAAYWLSSQADRVVSTPSGGVGSIGVVMMHMDVSKLLDDVGIKVTFIHAGKHKVDGNMFQPLSKEVTAQFQAEIDAIYDDFTSTVSAGRGIEQSAVAATEAQVYGAKEALSLGLIDAVQTPSEAVTSTFTEHEDALASHEGTADMTTPMPKTEAAMAETNAAAQAQADAAAAQARTAERSRISGIQGHAEAAGRESLANHLAMNTNMSVEEAGAILAASPKATPAAAAEPANPFKEAMSKTQNPNVGNGGSGASADEDNRTPAQRILASYGRVATSAEKH